MQVLQSYCSGSVVAFPWQPRCNQGWILCVFVRGRYFNCAEERTKLLNELRENSLNQKSKSRLSLEIIQRKSAPHLPVVAMEISPTIFGWIQHRSWGDMWRMRMCLCEWLCACVGASICVCVTVRKCVFVYAGFFCHIESLINYISTVRRRFIDNVSGHFSEIQISCPLMSHNSSLTRCLCLSQSQAACVLSKCKSVRYGKRPWTDHLTEVRPLRCPTSHHSCLLRLHFCMVLSQDMFEREGLNGISW